jgi:hypothetical protein
VVRFGVLCSSCPRRMVSGGFARWLPAWWTVACAHVLPRLASSQQLATCRRPAHRCERPGRGGRVPTSSLASCMNGVAPPQPANISVVPPRVRQERRGSSATGRQRRHGLIVHGVEIHFHAEGYWFVGGNHVDCGIGGKLCAGETNLACRKDR